MRLLKYGLLSGIMLFAFCLAFVLAPVVLAFEGRSGDQVVIAADEVIEDDLYVGANRLVINGIVKGDVVAAATIVEVNGSIEGDLMAGAQTVIINGEVTDDLRVGATAITIGERGKIGDDLLVGGYSLETRAGSVIGGHVGGGTGQTLLNGSVGGNVNIGAGGLVLNGPVAGNVTAEVSAPGQTPPFNPFVFMPNAPAITPIAPGLSIGANAIISGLLTYRTSVSATIPADAVIGGVNFVQVAQAAPEDPLAPASLQRRGIRAAQYWGVLLLLGLLFVAIARRLTRNAADVLGATAGQSFVWGIAALILFPLVLALLAGMLIALSFGLSLAGLGDAAGTILWVGILTTVILALLFVLALGLFTKITVSYQLGRWITGSLDGVFWPLFLGALIVALLVWLPYAGGVLSLLITLYGLGALWLGWRGPVKTAAKVDPYQLGS